MLSALVIFVYRHKFNDKSQKVYMWYAGKRGGSISCPAKAGTGSKTP